MSAERTVGQRLMEKGKLWRGPFVAHPEPSEDEAREALQAAFQVALEREVRRTMRVVDLPPTPIRGSLFALRPSGVLVRETTLQQFDSRLERINADADVAHIDSRGRITFFHRPGLREPWHVSELEDK